MHPAISDLHTLCFVPAGLGLPTTTCLSCVLSGTTRTTRQCMPGRSFTVWLQQFQVIPFPSPQPTASSILPVVLLEAGWSGAKRPMALFWEIDISAKINISSQSHKYCPCGFPKFDRKNGGESQAGYGWLLASTVVILSFRMWKKKCKLQRVISQHRNIPPSICFWCVVLKEWRSHENHRNLYLLVYMQTSISHPLSLSRTHYFIYLFFLLYVLS